MSFTGLGQIKLMAFNFDTDSWMQPDSKQISTTEYPELYALIGHKYNKQNNLPIKPGLFALPETAIISGVHSYIQVTPYTQSYELAAIGEIVNWAPDDVPKGWFPCDGRALQISEYKSLYSVLGTRFTTNPNNKTFNIPTIRPWGTQYIICADGFVPDYIAGYLGGITLTAHENSKVQIRHGYPCDGRALSIYDHPNLFNLLGYRYGGSGSTFNIPKIPGLLPGINYYICKDLLAYPDPKQKG